MRKTRMELQVYLYLLLLPFLDIMKFLFGNDFEIFGISVVEVFNFSFCFYFLIRVIYNKFIKEKESFNWKIGLFGLITFIYIVFHLINVLNANEIIVGQSNNIILEFYYIARSYLIPGILLYSFLNIDIEENNVIKVFSFLAFIISFIIVVSNVFNFAFISYDSYLDGKNVILGNIFSWSSSITNSTADLFTSKGLFTSSNQLSLILIPLLLISSLHLQRSKKWYLFLTFLLKITAMVMISTKTCFIGIIIVLLFSIFINIILKLVKDETFDFICNSFFIICILFSLILFLVSPLSYKIGYNHRTTIDDSNDIEVENVEKKEVIVGDFSSLNLQNYIDNMNVLDNEKYQQIYNDLYTFELSELIKKDQLTKDEENKLILILEKCGSFFGIHKSFVKLFPVKNNFDFWFSSIKTSPNNLSNFRIFKGKLYYNYIEKNKNKLFDSMLGIGYESNFPYTETDGVAQFIWFGYFGLILFVGIYYLLFIINIIITLINFRMNFTKINLYLLFSEFLMLSICLITGHCFGNIFPMTVLVLLLVVNYKIIINNTFSKSETTGKKRLLFIIWSFSYGGGAEKILSNLVNNLNKEKYEIDVLEYWHSDIKIEKVNNNINVLKPVVDSTKASKIEMLIKKILVEYFPMLLRCKYAPGKYDVEIAFNYMIPTFLLDRNAVCFSWMHGDINDLKENNYKRKLQARSLKKVKGIITISKNTYNSIVDVYPHEEKKIVIINNGLQLEYIQTMAKKEKINKQSEITYFSFVGRLDDNKNPQMLIEIAKKLKERRLNYKIMILGTGNLFEFIKKEVKKYKLRDYIEVKGYVKNPYPYISNSKAILLCSKSEGFPTVLLEGIMLDTPFISTNVGGVMELTKPKKCGSIANDASNFVRLMEKYVTDNRYYSDLVNNCLSTKYKYTLEEQINKLESLLKEYIR